MHLRHPGRLALTVTAGVLFCLSGSLQARPSAPKLPTDLDLVPPEAAGFVHVNVADLWKHPALADLRQMIARVNPDLLKLFNEKTVPAPATINRITLVFPTLQTLAEPAPAVSPVALSALLLVSTSEPFERHKLVHSLIPEARTKIHVGKEYELTEATWSTLFVVDDRHFVYGTEDSVQWFLERVGTGKDEGTLHPALQEAANRKHLITAGVNGVLLNREIPAELTPPELQALRQTEFGLITLDLDAKAHLEILLQFGNQDRAAAGLKAVRAGLALACDALQFPIAQGEQQLRRSLEADAKGPAKAAEHAFMLAGLGMLKEIEARLKALPVEKDGSAVRVKHSADLAQSCQGTALVCITAITALGSNANATFSTVGAQIGRADDLGKAQLEPIAAALDRYHKQHGHFPPPALLSKDGKPLLSWRVLLLPHMGEEELYKQFKLDEPWDSPTNKKLLLRLPQAYRSRTFGGKAWETRVLAFTGPDTVFAGPRGMRREDIRDGTATTLLAVLASEDSAASWSKPADIAYDAKRPVPPWLGRGFTAIMADGGIRHIQAATPETTLRALITPRGGEQVFLPEK
jgi:Protein of unknown function (DUF1559)